MARGDREGPREQFRVRVIAFVLVPVLVLGVCYLLLVEYVAVQPGVVLGESLVGLRLGGAALILLALVLAVAAGYLLADRVSRPIRLLLRFAESGELPSGAGLFVHHRDWEVFLLYRRIQALIQQNRAGAGALDELESLRASFDVLRAALTRTGQNGILAPLGITEGPCQDIAELLEGHRARLLDFFRDLKSRTEELRTQFEALELVRNVPAATGTGGGRGAGDVGRNGASGPSGRNGDSSGGSQGIPVGPVVSAELSSLVEELRGIGTVLSLEVERMRGDDGEVGRLYREFRKAIDRLEELTRTPSPEAELPMGVAGPAREQSPSVDREPDRGERTVDGAEESGLPVDADIDEVWQRLREDLGSLERRLEEVEER